MSRLSRPVGFADLIIATKKLGLDKDGIKKAAALLGMNVPDEPAEKIGKCIPKADPTEEKVKRDKDGDI